jgi:hypothetical protein
MENRRVLPLLHLEKARKPPIGSNIDSKNVRTTTPEENAQVSDAIARRKKFDEGKAKAQGAYKQILKEGAMKRSYTIDEMTVATLLKGHPEAQEILDELLKGKKKNESGEEFQDGSEDTIGGEGHAAVARPDSIKHEGKPSGIGPNEPGTGTKKASIEDGDLSKSEDEGDDVEKSDRKSEQGQSARSAAPGTDAAEYYTRRSKASKMGGSRPGKEMPTGDAALREYRAKNKSEQLDFQKSDNLADNLPDEFEDEMEDDDTIPPEKNAKKSMTADEAILSHLLKTMGADRMEEIVKAVIGGRNLDPGQVSKKYAEDPREAGNVAGGGPLKGEDNPLTNKKINPTALAALKQGVGTGGAAKSEESDLEKSEDNMSEEYSLDFSKSIMERMGLEKGATSVSKEAGGGKATQINYGSKPTTRFKHPKAKSDKKYIHNPEKGTVKVEKEGEKTKEIGVSEQGKLKNASVSSADLYKSLDAILEKKTVA